MHVAPVPTLSFSSDRYVVLESDGTVELCLVLNVPLTIPALDVIVTTTATATDTATAGITLAYPWCWYIPSYPCTYHSSYSPYVVL